MIQSPCIQVCTLDRKTGYCLGCARTADEIMAWSKETETYRLAVWDKLPARAKALGISVKPKPNSD